MFKWIIIVIIPPINIYCALVTVEACRHDITLPAFGQLSTGIRKKRAQKCRFYCQQFCKQSYGVILNMAIRVVMCVISVIHTFSVLTTNSHRVSLIYLLSTSHLHTTCRAMCPRLSSKKHIGVANKVANWAKPVWSLPNVYLAFT